MKRVQFFEHGAKSMRAFGHIAAAIACSVPLIAAAEGFVAPTSHPSANSGNQPVVTQSQGQTQGGTQAPAQSGEQAVPYGGDPLTSDQLNKEYQNLSPQARAALANQLKSKGIDGLTKMSEGDARTSFSSLPPEVKAQIQAKWDAMSDEQRIALKKMGPGAVKEIVAAQMKEMMRQSVSPMVRPVQQVAEKARSAAEKAKWIMQKGRDYVQGLIARMKGGSNPPEGGGGN
jgi:hypothetical protein